MPEPRALRRLAAILAADVVGFSRLMGEDEAGTLAALKSRRADILAPLVARHQGRVVKLMGDGVLVEFASAVDAVQCAVALQAGFGAANEDTPEGRRIVLRIGINLGDVIVEGADLYGDGVNIAARLEALAEPGGICVSAKVFAETQGKVAVQFADLGEQVLKNIAQPLHVYKTSAQPPAATGSGPPVRPSVAVLPFTNMSGDAEQDYFSDGLTEDIITELSRFKGLHVCARNSTFKYKGMSPNIQTLGRELGVNYVVEGSVRKSGNRVRVTAQLIETTSGGHLWAERYDRDLADIFAVQDEVVQMIAGVVPGQIDRDTNEAVKRKHPANLTAYDRVLRGRWAFSHFNEGVIKALEWFERAITADPDFGLAHACLANALAIGLFELGLPPEETLQRAREHARRACVLDPGNAQVNAYASVTYMLSGDSERAVAFGRRAVGLNPNDSTSLNALAQALNYSGEHRGALEWFSRSEKLDPYTPDDSRFDGLCDCYYMLGDYEKVLEIHRGGENLPSIMVLVLAAACAQLGRTALANEALAKYQEIKPSGHDAATMIKYHVRLCAMPEDRERWLEGYRKIGFDL